jgi:hypothetical protein
MIDWILVLKMDLKKYFENIEGFGTLSTVSIEGKVNSALYSRPYVGDNDTLAFIMSEKLTHQNINENPYAFYLFKENEGYKGIRIYLKMIREEKDCELVENLRRRKEYRECTIEGEHNKFVVFFKIVKVLPLVGTK